MAFDLNKLLHEIAEDFGVAKDEECKVGKCIVYLKTTDEGWKPLSYEDEALTVPCVCDCEHEAFKDVANFLGELAVQIAIVAMLSGEDSVRLPKRTDFKLVNVELPEEAEITSVDDAAAVINHIKGMH